MTAMAMKQQDDQDAHKGADRSATGRPTSENSAQETDALDENGLPADCDRIAEDAIGANEDKSQG